MAVDDNKLLWSPPEYVKSLRRKDDGTEREFFNYYLGEHIPVNYPVIDAWKKYYADMEALDRKYHHAPARRGNMSVIPQPNARWHPNYYKERTQVKDTLHRTLGEHGRSPTSTGYDEQDMALHEHERELKPCECSLCRQCR